MADVKSTAGLRPELFGDAQLVRFQAGVANATQAARTCPLVNGAAVTGVQLSASAATNVTHKLSRAWAGWFVTNTNVANAGVATAAAQPDKGKFLSLTCTADVTVDLWVF